jgi:hypothetical protein
MSPYFLQSDMAFSKYQTVQCPHESTETRDMRDEYRIWRKRGHPAGAAH